MFLVQIALVLTATQIVGSCMRPLRQRRVVGEIIAGIALGPSLLGRIAPRLFAAVVPAG